MQPSNETLGLAVPGIVLFLAFAGIVYFKPGPLKSDRPPEQAISNQSFTIEAAPARLWQDPFQAVEQELKARKDTVGPTTEDPAAKNGCEPGKLKVLAVMVVGGPYAESVESRQRDRYAILSGLSADGYLPVDPTHIGYFELKDKNLPAVVPFEMLRRNGNGATDDLLLLWVNNDAFNRSPIRTMKTLLGSIPARIQPQFCIDRDVKVMGPADSDALVALLREGKDAAPPKCGDWQLQYFSARATANESILRNLALGESADGRGCNTVERCLKGKVDFRPHIPNDGALAKKLAEELKLRGLVSDWKPPSTISFVKKIDKCLDEWRGPSNFGKKIDKCLDEWRCDKGSASQPPKHVVLISEWDTTYGRSLPVAVAEELGRIKPASRSPPLSCVKPVPLAEERGRSKTASHSPPLSCVKPVTLADLNTCPSLHYFSYMRGLDGKFPGGREKDEDKGSTSPSGAQRSDSSPASALGSERAEGVAQLDYLRRLTKAIKALKSEDGTAARIFAIGILGSDMHDKMLILKALRPELPSATFFTTDLDSRLWDASNAPWTRGLVVASGFGLNPADDGAGHTHIPPFRTSYQTALYRAVREAVAQDKNGSNGDKTSQGDVAIYEVGRSGPVELTPAVNGTRPADNDARDKKSWRARTLAAGFFLLTLVGVAFLHYNSLRRFVRGHPMLFVGSIALVILVFWVIWTIFALDTTRFPDFDCADPYQKHPCIEPFGLSSGISGWVPFYLTMLALALSVVFIGVLFIKRHRTMRLIEEHYMGRASPEVREGLATPPRIRDGAAKELIWLRDHLMPAPLIKSLTLFIQGLPVTIKRRCGRTGESKRETLDTAEQVWARHRRRCGLSLSAILAFGLAGLFFLSVVSLFMVFGGGGGGAVRDEKLAQLGRDLRIWSTFFLALLAFLYLHIAAGARQLIEELDREHLAWRNDTRTHYAREKLRVDSRFVDRWISLRVVARYSDMAVRSVVYPLVVLLVLVAARLPWFDTQIFPIGILMAYVVLAFFLLGSAWLLQREARRMRQRTLDFYQRQLRDLERLKPWDILRRRQLRCLIERVETMRDFAFQRFSENPLVRAAILPFGTLGLGLLEVFG